jgi:arylformamidase
MQVFDLSLRLDAAMRTYPGDSPPRIARTSSIADGARLTASVLEMSCHVGTHVDAPAHFVEHGRMLSDYDASAFVGAAFVVDCGDADAITRDVLARVAIPPGHHVLLRTRNSRRARARTYDLDHAYVAADGAEYLLTLTPASIGFDDYSVDASSHEALPIHRRLAEHGLLVYVALDLSELAAGGYMFCGLPLRLANVEAAPVRAIAWRDAPRR